jgi:predicted TIM-barrel fold metal-dependent hydrolase
MSRVDDHRIHDADAHIFETADWLIRHADPDVKARIKPLDLHGQESTIAHAAEAEVARKTNPEMSASAGEIAARNWEAPGAFDPVARSRSLDVLGFTSQLIFSTYSHLTFINNPGAPAGSDFSPDVLYAAVRAHNRGMVDFCSADRRLLPVGWVAIDDPQRAVDCCREALDMGCAGIELPTYPTGPLSLTHPDLHPIYRMLEEANQPLLFHVGGGGRVVDPVFQNNGSRSIVHALTFVGISAPIEMALSALVLDGVFEKFPKLMCGVIEHGATWLPGLMRRLDYAVGAFDEGGARAGLSLWPSQYVLRNMRVTPFPFEDVGWLISECGDCVFLFGSDYPHDEGGTDPIAMFEATMGDSSRADRDRFYWRNFEELMGRGLTNRLPDHVGRERADPAVPVPRDWPTGPPAVATTLGEPGVNAASENIEVSRKKALMRLLAREAAQRVGVSTDPGELQAAVDEFRRANGLLRLADTHSWMQTAGVTEEMLISIIRDGVLLEKVGDALGEQLAQETEAQTRVASARQWSRTNAIGTR